jgi:phage terminase small subunit
MEDNYNLTPRERRFCEEYLRTGKKEQSAIAAGYKEKSARNQATKLMKKEEVLAYIRAIQKQAREELHIDDNWAVLRAIEVYHRCMQAVPVLEWDYSEHKMVETGEYTFDSKGALKALELIKSLLGLGEEDTDKLAAAVTFIDDFGGGKGE